ncbi:PilZ domain protein [compost metagenome]
MAKSYFNSRAHLRLNFADGVPAELMLVNKEGEPLTRSKATVKLLNVSQNGLSFTSDLQLPVDPHYFVEFRMQLSRDQIIVRGQIVWCKLNQNRYVHGVKFVCSNTLRSFIVGSMNQILLERQPQIKTIHAMYSR